MNSISEEGSTDYESCYHGGVSRLHLASIQAVSATKKKKMCTRAHTHSFSSLILDLLSGSGGVLLPHVED